MPLESAERLSVVHTEPEFPRDGGESLVDRPERKLGEHRGCQQVHIDPAQSTPHQLLCFDECHDLGVARSLNLRQLSERTEKYCATREIPARQLSDDKGVCPNLSLFEKLDERGVAPT